MNKFWGHLKTITHHRHLVMRGCFRMGLIWQGLTHDLSKYSPTELVLQRREGERMIRNLPPRAAFRCRM